ncbi:MAG: YvcK family protein [Candidatus Doudnabacteria bacterium]|nr:YvcK family protein [Candidatus Doudnabacteria bacterium]
MKNIVIIGGGTGTFTLLSGLREYPSNNTVVVSSADDGGSTGVLRKELGVMPPGDIRQCLVGLSYTQKEMRELFSFRFGKGSLAGHTAGNIILAALEKITGNIDEAINLASKMLNVRGQVMPVTLEPTVLSAKLKNGKRIIGEHNIDDQDPGNKTSPIKNLRLSSAKANPKTLNAIAQADVIIFGPGDLYTSILPNVLVKGMKEAINKSLAKKVLIVNIMTKFGQTDGFKASDFLTEMEKYLGGKIGVVLTNNKKPASDILRKYAKEKAKFVEPDLKSGKRLMVISEDLISKDVPQKKAGDKLKRSFLRHDCGKIAKLIWSLV